MKDIYISNVQCWYSCTCQLHSEKNNLLLPVPPVESKLSVEKKGTQITEMMLYGTVLCVSVDANFTIFFMAKFRCQMTKIRLNRKQSTLRRLLKWELGGGLSFLLSHNVDQVVLSSWHYWSVRRVYFQNFRMESLENFLTNWVLKWLAIA